MKSFDDILEEAYNSKEQLDGSWTYKTWTVIQKDEFVALMTAMKEQRKIDNKATDHLQEIFIDVIGGFYPNDILFTAIETFLRNSFHDEGDWILYFIYDLADGSEWKEDSCTEKDGTTIDLSTVEKLYDFLIRNMNETD